MSTWDDGSRMEPMPLGLGGGLLAAVRVTLMAVIIFGLMGPMVLLRLSGFRNGAQSLVVLACRGVLRVIGIPIVAKGRPMDHAGAVVANHCSWLDIFSLNAVQRVLFVSKSEVQNWPLIGIIARSVGTVFIERRTSHAARHRNVVADYIRQGQRLLFFPEGTSTDGRRVLPFKSSLFSAFYEDGLRESIWIQPVTLVYLAPEDDDPRAYAWWGDTDFAPHLFRTLALRKQGRIEVVFHDPIKVSDVPNRKEMARLCETAVRGALTDAIEVG